MRQPRRQGSNLRREVRDRRRHVLGEPARAQEPRRAAADQAACVEQHRRLHGIVDFVVQRLDRLPQVDEAEDFAIEQIRADDFVRFGAGRFEQLVHEGATDAVDHAVVDVGGDDLALQRVARHVSRMALAQRFREVARERRRDPRVVGQRRGEKLVVQPDLAVREQHRPFGAGEADTLCTSLGDLFVARQELQRSIEPSRLLQELDEPLMRVEELWRYSAGNRQRLRLEDVVAQDQRRYVVGHLSEQGIALLFGQLALGDRQPEQDLDVDLMIRRVYACRVVDGVRIDAAAGEGIFDAAKLRAAEVAAFGERPAAELASVDAQRVVGAVADLCVRLGLRLDVGSDAAVVDQVDRCVEDGIDELRRCERIRGNRERSLDLGRDRDRLGTARMDAASCGDQLGIVIRP